MTTKLNNNTAQKVSSRDNSNRLGQSINRLPTLEGAFVADAKAAKEKYERTEFIRTNTKKIDKTSAGSTRKVTEKPFLHLADSESTKNRRGQTSAGPLSFKLGELGRLNERKGVTLNLQDGTGGPNNRKGALGDDEPGANINNGVTNGTLDKQGNPSSRPSFRVDSRRATTVDGVDLGYACLGAGISGAWKGFTFAGPWGTIPGALLGCSSGMVGVVIHSEVKDSIRDYTQQDETTEEKTEEKKAEEKKEEDKKTDSNKESQDPTLKPDELVCEDPETQDQKSEESDKEGTTTPKPDGDSSKGSPNVSSEEINGLATSGRGSLQDPGSDEDMPVSMNDAAIIDPFGRVKAKRDTQSYPTGEEKGAGNMQLPTGNVWDSLIQPVDPDGNTPSPTNPSKRL